jgi:hypothetical protein
MTPVYDRKKVLAKLERLNHKMVIVWLPYLTFLSGLSGGVRFNGGGKGSVMFGRVV